ncbi:hypothetical protein DICVIV_01099 [Dictyocaulus viviparus]|uniref:Uncharacterized protein n=1 Tax=Dictyocaulus viviparus TaxID=29172 RepID=A0A0D8Y6Z5_DICVI|nr:hypothetical protein DICVIV_01099 [Dictyocaulus viviparus]
MEVAHYVKFDNRLSLKICLIKFVDISEESEGTSSMPPGLEVTNTSTSSPCTEDGVKPPKEENQENENETTKEKEQVLDMSDCHMPRRTAARSISECESAEDREGQRRILRNSHLAKVRPIMGKRQSFDLPKDERHSVEATSEQDVIEKYYQRNQATINSLQSRTLRRNAEHRHPVSLVSERSGRSEIVMPSPEFTQRNNFSKSFYWVAANHKKIGFRHIFMLLLVLIYTLLGALMFYLIESNYEKDNPVFKIPIFFEYIVVVIKEVATFTLTR